MDKEIPVGGPLLRWKINIGAGTVDPVWVFSDRRGRIRLVGPDGETEDLTPSEYHYRVFRDTREEALRFLLLILQGHYNVVAHELGEPEIASERLGQ